jgi:hypothetical protein
MVRFGLIEEPQHATLALATFHQVEVGCREQNCRCFGYRRQNSLAPIGLLYSLDGQRLWLIPHKPGMTLRMF